MTRMTDQQEEDRARVENALAALSSAGLLLDHQARLRIQQAVQRDPRLGALLGPVVEVIDRTQDAIGQGKAVLADWWRDGESTRWRPPSSPPAV